MPQHLEEEPVVQPAWKLWQVAVVSISLLLALVLIWYVTEQKGTWPIEPVGEDHPIANTHGEVVFACASTGWKAQQHNGVDILASPYPQQSAPDVVVAADGTIVWRMMVAGATRNQVKIKSDNGEHIYEYTHLAYGTFLAPFSNAYWQGTKVYAGDRIAKIEQAFDGEDNHLHFHVEAPNQVASKRWFNPLREITPNLDQNAPHIADIHLGRHDGNDQWEVFAPGSTSVPCTKVEGEVDIIVEVSDRDDAGSANAAASNVGVYGLAWLACPAGVQNCQWKNGPVYEDMHEDWTDPRTTGKRVSLKLPFKTRPEPWSTKDDAGDCEALSGDTRTYLIAAENSDAASWSTSSVPDGIYTLTVRASDYSGLTGEKAIQVCVENAGS
jgi:hypothetical protein